MAEFPLHLSGGLSSRYCGGTVDGDALLGQLRWILVLAALVVALTANADWVCEVTFSAGGEAAVARLAPDRHVDD